MAKKQDTPNLPGSSRMQMPMTSDKTSGFIKETGGMAKGSSNGATRKVIVAAKGKSGMKSMNPYC